MSHVKFVAAGFAHDAGQLLNDFVKESSLEFSVFSKVWRKRKFSLIYMGRSSEAELTEFTHEIFKESSHFLMSSSSIYFQVGAIYLLYALFRNQIVAPAVRIRLLADQWKVLMHVREIVGTKEHRCLYIIDYLIKHSMDFVACPTLMGPSVSLFREKSCRDFLGLHPSEMADIKSNAIELAESRVLENMSEIFAKYTKTKRLINATVIHGERVNCFEKFSERLQNFIEVPEFSENIQGKISEASIRERRFKLKEKASGRSTYVQDDSDPDEDSSGPSTKGASVGIYPFTEKGHAKHNGKIRKPKKPEVTNAESHTSKPKSSNKRNNHKKAGVWGYCEETRTSCDDSDMLSDCDDPNVYWYKNLPLLTDINTVLSSDTEEFID